MTRLQSHDKDSLTRHPGGTVLPDHLQRIAYENTFSSDGYLMAVSHVARTNMTGSNTQGYVSIFNRTK